MKKLTHIALATALALSGLSASAQTLLNASYDVAREFYKDYNAAFIANYKKTTGKDIKIDQAHGGSSAQARAVNDGLDADVVTMNTTTDVDFLASTGVVVKDWQKRFQPQNRWQRPHGLSGRLGLCQEEGCQRCAGGRVRGQAL